MGSPSYQDQGALLTGPGRSRRSLAKCCCVPVIAHGRANPVLTLLQPRYRQQVYSVGHLYAASHVHGAAQVCNLLAGAAVWGRYSAAFVADTAWRVGR